MFDCCQSFGFFILFFLEIEKIDEMLVEFSSHFLRNRDFVSGCFTTKLDFQSISRAGTRGSAVVVRVNFFFQVQSRLRSSVWKGQPAMARVGTGFS